MASPAKRRVLAPLDANAGVSASPLSLAGKLPPSPSGSAAGKKRSLQQDSKDDVAASTTPPKKACLANDMSPQAIRQQPPAPPAIPSRPSLSPATSSVFDLSAMVNTSQATNITEPDVEAPRANASGMPTREQSRQRAEILKLRLGLARYKLRTGQVDVPLEQLRVVPAAAQRQPQHENPNPCSRSRTPLPVSPRRREWSAGEWVRQQQEHRQTAVQPRSQPPLPQRWALWGPASSSSKGGSSVYSTSGVPGSRDREQAVDARHSSSSSDEDEDDELDSRLLPQQPRHQLDSVDVIEDSDVSDQEGPKRRGDDDSEGDDGRDDGLPQLPQLRRLSPSKKTASSTKGSALTTPRGNRLLVDDGSGSHLDRLTSSAMRGSAVNGLLSLARS